MGCESEDLKNDWDGYFRSQNRTKPKQRRYTQYRVRVLHRVTRDCVWTGVVDAKSIQETRKAVRIQYPDILDIYTHDHGLEIIGII